MARAPGRLDVMFGIAENSGSLVLPLPLREAAHAAVQLDDEPMIRVASAGAEANGRSAGARAAAGGREVRRRADLVRGGAEVLRRGAAPGAAAYGAAAYGWERIELER